MNVILDPAFKVVVLALLAWALKGYIMEKTAKRRATDQSVTLGELQGFCKEKHVQVAKDVNGEIIHVSQMLEKDLEHGRGRFTVLEENLRAVEVKMGGHHDALIEINLTLVGIKEELAARNGKPKKATP